MRESDAAVALRRVTIGNNTSAGVFSRDLMESKDPRSTLPMLVFSPCMTRDCRLTDMIYPCPLPQNSNGRQSEFELHTAKNTGCECRWWTLRGTTDVAAAGKGFGSDQPSSTCFGLCTRDASQSKQREVSAASSDAQHGPLLMESGPLLPQRYLPLRLESKNASTFPFWLVWQLGKKTEQRKK